MSEAKTTPKDRDMMDRLHEVLVDQFNPLLGQQRGRLVAFRFYALVSDGGDHIIPTALAAFADPEAPLNALSLMLDEAEVSRAADAAPTTRLVDHTARN